VFLLLTLLLPLVAFAALEGTLRATHYRGDVGLLVRLPFLGGRYAGVNKRFAGRYFVGMRRLPTASNDIFLVTKPANGFRVFVLGESSANGFPYGYNGTFSRVLREALRDVLPSSTVEVVNLGIAATNTYALYDEIDEVLGQRPDAVVIYVGHNEYYGALGAGSTQRAAGSPPLLRAYLRMQRRFKTVLLARELAVGALRRVGGGRAGRDGSTTLMQEMVREDAIPLDAPTYRRGRTQFRDNLTAILHRFREARVPVFIGSLASNLRDQAPFRSVRSGTLPAADQVFAQARQALGRRDLAEARRLFSYARDLDGLRFRAPGEFNAIIREVARHQGARYVPVAEAFAAASPDSIEGSALFWEHVHPNQAGYHLIGRLYFEAFEAAGFLGRAADRRRLGPWETYLEGMELTEFDRRFAWHQVRSLTSRWPFVERQDPAGYPASYRPTDTPDSLAFEAVNGGLVWPSAKIELASRYRAELRLAEALAEYRGLLREQPVNPSLMTFAADTYQRMGDSVRARALLEHAYQLEPSGLVCFALGTLELTGQRYPRAIRLLEESLRYAPDNPPALNNLSRAYLLTRDVPRARAYADRLARVNPGFPGLREWRAMLAALPE
jgi:tetratricopeptide (TPR) repeat protein